MKKKLEEGQVVRCTVDKIRGTIVFVKIDDYDMEGTIIFSEISPGRIRNIRDYVSPGKKIICKVLKASGKEVYLSLRRVKLKEKNELNEAYKRERSFLALLRTVLKSKEKAEKIVEKIKDREEISEFLEDIKENSKPLEKYISKQDAEKIAKILQEKVTKEKILTRKFSLSSKSAKGISLIKNIIKEAIKEAKCENCQASYIAAGKYVIKVKTIDPKKSDMALDKVIENLESLAKKQDCDFAEA